MDSRKRIIISTLIASFIVFGDIQPGSADNITIDELIGKWYTIGVISPTYDGSSNIACYGMNISNIDEQHFAQNITLKINDIWKQVEGYGRIDNSEVRVFFRSANNTSAYSTTSYNSGREIILHDLIRLAASYALISRNIFVSMETREIFDQLAEDNGVIAVYFDHDNCSNDI